MVYMYYLRFVIAGTFYSLVYIFLAATAAGFGHGTYIFFSIMGPYSLGVLVYPILGYLLPILPARRFRIYFLLIMTLHYVLVGYFFIARWQLEKAYVENVWRIHPENLLVPFVWFLLGEALLWGGFVNYSFFRREHP